MWCSMLHSNACTAYCVLNAARSPRCSTCLCHQAIALALRAAVDSIIGVGKIRTSAHPTVAAVCVQCSMRQRVLCFPMESCHCAAALTVQVCWLLFCTAQVHHGRAERWPATVSRG